MQLINWDCLKEMDKLIEQWVKVDAIITDPPYWTTACKWDSVIPFDEMWKRLNKLIKPNGTIVLFGSEPFSSALRISNIKNYKYDWVWNKKIAGAFMVAKYRPLWITENIHIFWLWGKVNYYPIMVKGKMRSIKNKWNCDLTENFKWLKGWYNWGNSDMRYPKNIIEVSNADRKNKVHPTQKPVALMEYLIKTYTQEWELVLDFTAGSFTTCVACDNTNRKWIWIEMSEEYCKIWKERILKNREEKWLNLLNFISNI